MTQIAERDGVVLAPRLGALRSLLVVAAALAIAVAARYGVNEFAASQALAEQEAAPGSWDGLGTALLGATTAFLLGFVVAVAGVGIGVRGRRGSGRFTVVFTAALVAALIVQTSFSGALGAIPLPRFGAPGWWALVIASPMLWALPAASVGALRWRWFAVVAVVVASAAVLAVTALGSASSAG